MKMEEQVWTESKIRSKTLWSIIIFIALLIAAIVCWKWIISSEKDQGTPKPLRAVLNTNESIFTAMFNQNRLSKTYPASLAAPRVRVNGDEGMSEDFNPDTWKLQLIRKTGDTVYISLDEIKSLPKTEIIFDFKCIEGWNQVSHWGGVRFSDFVKKYKLEDEAALQFTGMHTPDNGYYVGVDNKSMMHPQTLLCYELNGKPLPMKQGYPLRLIIPVKYGVKHLKRIGTIYFSNNRPPDYWYERGYDYYCGF